MKKISFIKMSGAGNDFILFDKRENQLLKLFPDAISRLCDRRMGIGADGVLVIDDHPEYDFTMEYYNSDGSTGTLCGNGARCALKYASISGRLKTVYAKFLSNSIVYSGEILDNNRVKFNLGLPEDFRLKLKLKAGGQEIAASFVNTGSPHVVVNVEDILKDPINPASSYHDVSDIPVFNLGREIRYHADFAPGGTNVNFIAIKDNELFIRTYERGVEDETLACGTGSVASALIACLNYGLKSPVRLITKNGSELIVCFDHNRNDITNVSLSGPAEVTFNGEFFSNLYF